MERVADADQGRQSLGTAKARNDAELCSRMSKNGVGGGKAVRTGQRQIKSASHTGALYRRDFN